MVLANRNPRGRVVCFIIYAAYTIPWGFMVGWNLVWIWPVAVIGTELIVLLIVRLGIFHWLLGLDKGKPIILCNGGCHG